MTELLAKIFIKNRKEYDSPAVRKAYGTLSSIVGIVLNILLAAAKLLAGILAGSVAITADALNNLSDAGTSLIALLSFKISSKPADKNHPFGHARMEYIASMVVSFLILLVGVELFSDSLKRLTSPSSAGATEITPLTFVILSASILSKLWLGLFYGKIGKRIDSKVVRAAATDSLSDCVSTAAVLASSIVISLTGWTVIDAAVGIAVSVLIIIAGGKILIETKDAILGEGPVEETVEGIKAVVAEFPDVIGTHDLLVHNYGPKKFIASLHAEVDGKKDIYYLHDVIDNLERKIKDDLGISCTVHMDPITTDDKEVTELKEFLVSSMKDADIELPIHDFRTVVGNSHTNLIFDVVAPFDYPLSEDEIKDKISEAVNLRRDYCYCVITVDRE